MGDKMGDGRTAVERRSDREFVVTRIFDAPPRMVFEAWTKAELFQLWWAPRSIGVPMLACEMDARTGGGYSVTFGKDPSQSMTFYGKYLEVTPPSRLVWTNDESEDAAVAKVAELALRYKDERKRVLVYVRRPRDARRIADELAKATDRSRIALLTGTVRGYERDALAETALFKGFRSDPERQPPEATEYLVATSAGEVGVDLDADHLVCDLSTLDSMIQRLGRVNRLGRKDRQANVHVVEWPVKKDEGEKGKLDQAIMETKTALASLPKRDDAHDASPGSLRALADRTEAFAPSPRTVPLTDILLDNWSLTRVKDLPGSCARPSVPACQPHHAPIRRFLPKPFLTGAGRRHEGHHFRRANRSTNRSGAEKGK